MNEEMNICGVFLSSGGSLLVYLQTTNSRQNKISMRENRNVLFAQIKRFFVSQNKTNDNAL